jgi:hypothetical protein
MLRLDGFGDNETSAARRCPETHFRLPLEVLAVAGLVNDRGCRSANWFCKIRLGRTE